MSTHLKIQNLILLLHARQEGILGQVITLCTILFIRPLHLLLQRLHALREQAMQTELATLLGCERRPLVEERVVEQDRTPQRALEGSRGGEGEVAELFAVFSVALGHACWC